MAESHVRDWLNEYKLLEEAELLTFSSSILQNNDLIQALFTILEEKRFHQEFLDPVCEQLFIFYQSKEKNLQCFSQQFIPCLIGVYLSQVAKGTRKNVRSVEILLLGIYNLEIVDSSGKPTCVSFRIPSIAKPSIYHEPMSLSHSVLTEDALSSLDYADCRKYSLGPYDEIEKLNASNRLHVMTVLMWLYNQNVGSMSSYSHLSLCKMCTRLVKQGYSRPNRTNYANDCSAAFGNPHPRPIARIPVTTSFLLELVHAVYYAMFNGIVVIGQQSLDDLHNRATHEMMPEVLLVTNAIRNSLKVNPSGQPTDGPMGISISLSPTTVISSVCRAITNASFRTKKLPDDIPIQTNGEANESHQLSSINEEETPENTTQPASNRMKKSASNGSTSASSKVGVLQLKKDKNKDKQRRDSSHAESNGKSFPLSGSNHSDLGVELNSDTGTTMRYSNSEQMHTRHSFPFRAEPKSSLLSNVSSDGVHNCDENRTYEGKCANNFSNPDLNSVLKNDVKFAGTSGFHKSESANGIQNSSMQTAV